MGYIYDRKKNTTYEEKQYMQKKLEFLYINLFGRVLLKVITAPFFSKMVGSYYNKSKSTKKIPKFINDNNIDMSEFEEKTYSSFNDFFTRKKKLVVFNNDKNAFCSPADSKMMVYKITSDLKIKVKNSIYSLEELIKGNDNVLEEFRNGNCLVFRLGVEDYHRYHFIDSGLIKNSYYIKGKLHTVRSISEKYRVYAENCRVVNELETENFGRIYEIEVGALLVGRIVNHDIKKFDKGQEKGYFEYGGSTIVIITKDNIKIDDDIISASEKDIETKICIGETIGYKKK